MMDDDFLEQLHNAHETLTRLREETRSGRFTVGDEPHTRTPENIEAQVARIQRAIDDIQDAIKHYDPNGSQQPSS